MNEWRRTRQSAKPLLNYLESKMAERDRDSTHCQVGPWLAAVVCFRIPDPFAVLNSSPRVLPALQGREGQSAGGIASCRSALAVIETYDMLGFGEKQPAQRKHSCDMRKDRRPDCMMIRRCDRQQDQGHDKAEQECSETQLA